MNLKRTLTGIAAASMVLGTFAPAAFAATTYPTYNTWAQKSVVYNGSTLATPYTFVANGTTYFPVYYLEQMLKQLNPQASMTWDGTNLSINFPGANPQAASMVPGNGKIYVNGVLVQQFAKIVTYDKGAKGKVATTYAPLYPVQQLLPQLGFNDQWSVSGFTVTAKPTPPPVSSQPSLSSMTVSGQAMGSGTSTAPAASTNGSAITVSETLTDANGNPISGINVQFNVWGSTTAPDVTANGSTVTSSTSGGTTGSSSNNPFEYSVATNSAGVASLSIQASTGAYTVQAQAPYSNNGLTVTSNKVHLEYGQPGTVLLSPASSTEGFSTGSLNTGLVPVTATIIPVTGTTASNVQVTFNFSAPSGNPFVATSSGAYFAPTTSSATAFTNSGGQATIYVNATTAANLTVQASATVNGVSEQSSSTTLTWEQTGVPTQIVNTQSSPITVDANSNLTISGTAEDATGNPVANAQLLVSGYDNGNGDLNYVNGTTSTEFPNVGQSISGAMASSSYGELITTGANGQFSFTINDSNVSDPASVQVWSVQNGVITAVGSTNSSPYGAMDLYNLSVTQNASALSALYVDSSANGLANGTPVAANDEYTSLSNVSYQADSSSGAGAIYVGGFAGTAPYAPANSTVTYNIAATNKGYINYVDGVQLNGSNSLPNQPASAVVSVTYDSSGAISQVSVDGVNITSLPGSTVVGTSTGTAFTFVPGSTAVESDVFTITSGGQSATVNTSFTAGTPAKVSSVSPVAATINPGQSQTVAFTVEDTKGNPVMNTSVNFSFLNDQTNLWLTAVNGVGLQGNFGNNGTQPTPVPLFNFGSTLYGSGSVYTSGAVSATGVGTGSPSINVYTNSNGLATLTFTAGSVPYWNTTNDQVYTAPAATTTATTYFGYNSTNGGVYASNSSSVPNENGQLTW